jgi:hypothetical protein
MNESSTVCVTCDVVLRDDRATRIVEIGDGQVSDFPEPVNPTELVRALLGG